jgi:hypothetical protein
MRRRKPWRIVCQERNFRLKTRVHRKQQVLLATTTRTLGLNNSCCEVFVGTASGKKKKHFPEKHTCMPYQKGTGCQSPQHNYMLPSWPLL